MSIIKNPNIKHVEDIRIIRLYDGQWYCLFNDYRARRTVQMRGYSISSFRDWCKEHSVIPIEE